MSDSSTKPSATTRRKRTATPRSKTGCVTCKIRRLKCGEEHPNCRRCTKSGWSCDYKDTQSTRSDSQPSTPPAEAVDLSLAAIVLRHSSFTPSPTPSLYRLLDLDDTERLYFNAFIDDVSIQLPGHDSFFWGATVLQESHANYSVRHTIVAIGALSRSTQKVLSGAYRFNAPQCPHREYSLKQYQKAIQGLRHSMFALEEDDEVRSTLISCITLAFFDNFIGNGGSALQHVAFGRQVMCKSMRNLFSKSLSSGQDHGRIAGMFLRLESESFCAFGIEADRTFAISKTKQAAFDFPLYFVSIDDALLLRNQIVWEGYDLLYRLIGEGEHVSDALYHERDIFIQYLRHLNTLLDLLVQSSLNNFSSHPLRKAEALKLPSAVLLIRLASGLGPSSSNGDYLLSECSFLLEICRAALDYESMLNRSINEGEIFSFDVRVIAALSLVATKCRSLHLRRQAVDLLLSSHRREWMYDSHLSGKIGAWMLELEEQALQRKKSLDLRYGDLFGLVEVGEDWGVSEMVGGRENGDVDVSVESGEIGEGARTWDPVVEWDPESARRVRAKCKQDFRAEDGSIGWVWRETEIVW